jgi:hypothetical protein
MKKIVTTAFLLLIFSFNVSAADEEVILFKSLIGDKTVQFSLSSEKNKPDQFSYFSKKANSILKLKPHDSKFCLRDYLELSITKGQKTQKTLACVNSKTKLTKEMKKLANLLQVQYGKNQ